MPDMNASISWETPWDATVKQLLGVELSVTDFSLINTGYGTNYLGVTDFTDKDGEVHNDVRVLFGGDVLKDRIEEYLSSEQGLTNPYPVTLTVVRRRGSNPNGYFDIKRPDED